MCDVSREEARPGDLVFLRELYASAGAVSHVGIYVGGSRMLHCGSPIGYADLTSPYWNSHLYALEGWQLFRNEAAKNEICADLPGQFMDM